MPADLPLDQIRLSAWRLQVAIGAYEHERTGVQELVLDLKVRGSFGPAAAGDRLDLALDYDALRQRVEAHVTGRRWTLLEAFAEDLCRLVLDHPAAREVELEVAKPAALAPMLVTYTVTRRK